MQVRAELHKRHDGIIEKRTIDPSRLVLDGLKNEGMLRCKGDPELEGRKHRLVRKVVLNNGHAELQVGPSSAVVILPA